MAPIAWNLSMHIPPNGGEFLILPVEGDDSVSVTLRSAVRVKAYAMTLKEYGARRKRANSDKPGLSIGHKTVIDCNWWPSRAVVIGVFSTSRLITEVGVEVSVKPQSVAPC